MSEQADPRVRICRECGRPLDEGMDFCSWCGAYYSKPEPRYVIDDEGQPQASDMGEIRFSPQTAQVMQAVARSIHQLTIIMLSVWVFMSLIEGVPMVLMPDYIAKNMAEVYTVAPGYTEDMIAQEILTDGSILVMSGLLALASTLLCWKQRKWKLAMLLCILSAMVMFGPVVLYKDYSSALYVMCGIIVALRIKQGRGIFRDRSGPVPGVTAAPNVYYSNWDSGSCAG